MVTAQELNDGLSGFFCTTEYHKHSPVSLPYTDGVKYLAEKAEAFWLVDTISINHKFNMPLFKERSGRGFTFWKFERSEPEEDQYLLSCGDDTDESGDFVTFDTPGVPDPQTVGPVWEEIIPWTTFPLEKIELWVENCILILPSEH